MRYAVPLFFAVLPLTAQKCRLDGQVQNASTGQPLNKVQLMLLPTSSAISNPPGAVTNPDGHFTIEGIEPGRYRLMAQRDGFVSQEFGSKGPAWHGETLALASGDQRRDMVIRLMPLGVIVGRILDQDGDPIQSVEVNAMVFEYTRSGRRLTPKKIASTNDLGEYRIFGIEPGRYYLSARPAPAFRGHGRSADENYITSYYPGTPEATGATLLDLTAGQQLRGIDMTLRKTRAASIRGRAIKPPGGSPLMVGLMTVNGADTQSSTTSVSDPEGKFELRGVAPGPHYVIATSSVGDKSYTARVPVEVGSNDIEGIELHLLPPMEVVGQLRVEGNAKLPQLVVNIEGRRENSHGALVNSDGTFAFKSLVPDVYFLSLSPPGDLYLKAIRWGDTDITGSGLDLTNGPLSGQVTVILSGSGGQIEGSVEPEGLATVTLLPISHPRMRPYFKSITTAADGHFIIRGVAPGKYKLFAWDDVNADAVLYDPDFLKPFDSMGTTVEITENGKENVQLKLIT